MILSLRPVGGIFSKLATNIYLLDKTSLVCFDNLYPFFKVKGEFSLKICLEPVDGFHLT